METRNGYLSFDREGNPLSITLRCFKDGAVLTCPFTDKNLLTWNFRARCPECKQMIEVAILIVRTTEQIRRN